jgi:hypothetical protein
MPNMATLLRQMLLELNLIIAVLTAMGYNNHNNAAFGAFHTAVLRSHEERLDGSSMESSPSDVRLGHSHRRLDDGSGNADGNENNWISMYSLQFQGCHNSLEYHHSNGNHKAKIYVRRLVRFQLCKGCSSESNSGNSTSFYCTNNESAGEYVVDIHSFLTYFVSAQMASRKTACQAALANCGCSNNYYFNDNNNNNADASSCMQHCFDNDPSLGYYCPLLEQLNQLDVDDLYLECTQIKINNRQYYMGPSCSSDGSQILLALFTDNSCSIEATAGTLAKYNSNNNNNNKNDDSSTFFKYFSTGAYSIVGSDCVSCAADATDENYSEGNSVKYMCQGLYQQAGKCEQQSSSSSSYPSNPTTDACNFIQGIKITSNDGRVVYSARPSKTVGTWIGIFALSTILLGVYVYYLQVKVHRVIIELNNDNDPMTGGTTAKANKQQHRSSDDDSLDVKNYYYT